MNPLTRRRAARRRSIAEWAARAGRFFGGEPAAEATDYEQDEESRGTATLSEPAARRLPFELLDAPPQAVAVEPAPNGNGQATRAAEEPPPPAEPAAATSPPLDPAPVVDEAAENLRQAARLAAEQRDPVRAARLYRELLVGDPRDLRARNNLALALDQAGDHEAALGELDRCRAQEPHSLEVLINRSAVLGAMGRYGEAERELRVVLEREPTNAGAYFNLGVVASRRGRWREAVPLLRRAVELDGGQAAAHFYLGEALNHVDDLAGALQAYQRSVELYPRNPKALYGLGIVLDRMNRPEDAAQLYRRSRELQSK